MVRFITCKLENSKAKIQIQGIFEDGKDEEIYYQHPVTGQWCEDVNQVLQGWSEQNSKEQAEWEILVATIRQDDNLAQKAFEGVAIIEY